MKSVANFAAWCAIVFLLGVMANIIGRYFEPLVITSPCPEVSHD